MSTTTTFCHLSDYWCLDERALLKHLREIHENDANFQVSCSLCGRTYRKWCSLKKHLHRSHPSKSRKVRLHWFTSECLCLCVCVCVCAL